MGLSSGGGGAVGTGYAVGTFTSVGGIETSVWVAWSVLFLWDHRSMTLVADDKNCMHAFNKAITIHNISWHPKTDSVTGNLFEFLIMVTKLYETKTKGLMETTRLDFSSLDFCFCGNEVKLNVLSGKHNVNASYPNFGHSG